MKIQNSEKHIGDRIVGIIKTNYSNGLIMDETLLLLLITLCYSFIFELHMKIHTYTLDCMKKHITKHYSHSLSHHCTKS